MKSLHACALVLSICLASAASANTDVCHEMIDQTAESIGIRNQQATQGISSTDELVSSANGIEVWKVTTRMSLGKPQLCTYILPIALVTLDARNCAIVGYQAVDGHTGMSLDPQSNPCR